MRLSEKTIELNICSQLSLIHAPLIWFGLTQRQEARAGFDAWTRMGGRLLILQFKASNNTIRSKRRFELDHDQLAKLRLRIRSYERSVFYVLPLIGNSHELSQNPCFLTQTWLLDVAALQYITAPTKSDGTLRKNRRHHADVEPGLVTIWSEPAEFALLNLGQFAQDGFPGADGITGIFENFDQFWDFRATLVRHAAALFIIG